MLSKKQIDKKLKEYVKKHSRKGYSKHSIKKALVHYGFEESYVDGILKRHSDTEFAKKYALIASLLFVISIFSFGLMQKNAPTQKITAYATQTQLLSEGCCASVCQQTTRQECYGKFEEKKSCRELDECIVGCCIDKEGYCLTNYLLGNCRDSNASFRKTDCDNLVFCRNITDKSYASRLYNLKNKKVTGFSTIKVSSDYYKSSFNIRYYLYDKTDIISVFADIIDSNRTIGSIALYDDGFHNDGSDNDNVYGNNWQSSHVKEFEGIKKLDVEVTVKYSDGSEIRTRNAQIIILANNKCLPVYNEYSRANNRSIIIAADNYKNLSDGFEKFQSDSLNFLDLLFSTDKFAANIGIFNIFRIEQSLSYFNTQTLASIISNFCPSYSNKKDLIIILDNDESYCVREGPMLVRTNPQALLYSNISDYEINGSMDDLCSFILTPRMLADQIINFASPPNITIDYISNLTINATEVNVSFTIAGTNYPINIRYSG